MKTHVSTLLGILLIGMAATGSLSAQQGGGNCTNYGCKVINVMQGWNDYTGWYPCYEFMPGNGRMVRNTTGSQGGRL
jgi:hypothetical protein